LPDGPAPLTASAAQALRSCIDSLAVVESLDTAGMRLPELAGAEARTIVLLPLRANGEELGLLLGATAEPAVFEHDRAELAALFASHAAASLDAAIVIGRERRSAVTDSLTGLLNRRGFEQRLDVALEAAREQRSPLNLVVMDCDDFKGVNDRAGHAFGDALLRELGTVLARCLPDDAEAARFGGDEFVVMLPGVLADAVGRTLEGLLARMRDGLQDGGFPISLSAGVATYPYDGGAASQLVRAADQALYEAKERGKNRVVTFRDIARRGLARREGARSGRERGGQQLADDAAEAVDALWEATTAAGVLEQLCKSATFVVGATAALVARIDDDTLVDVAKHTLRDIDLGPQSVYPLSEFPLTRDVISSGRSMALSFLDDALDPAEAFILRELGMSSSIMAPLIVSGLPWGLFEVYDMRLRRYTPGEQALADLLVLQAGRRLEVLGTELPAQGPRRVWQRPR
jgi:diguanylate cyclase (GGDEF)-like protein